MEKFQNKYRIPSARASWWDYSANGIYFITICTHNRECLFGNMVTIDSVGHIVETVGRQSLHTAMQLSPIGEIVHEEWIKSFEIRNELFCDAFVIMPNHIHAILRIDKENIGIEMHNYASMKENRGNRPPKSISSFVAGFKSSATKRINEYRNKPKMPVWQTRFHDRIVRDNREYKHIVNYINNNPSDWANDKFYKW